MEDRSDYYPSHFSRWSAAACGDCEAIAVNQRLFTLMSRHRARSRADGGGACSYEALAQEGMTMLVVTHEMNFARTVSKSCDLHGKREWCRTGIIKGIFEHPKENAKKGSCESFRSNYWIVKAFLDKKKYLSVLLFS